MLQPSVIILVSQSSVTILLRHHIIVNDCFVCTAGRSNQNHKHAGRGPDWQNHFPVFRCCPSAPWQLASILSNTTDERCQSKQTGKKNWKNVNVKFSGGICFSSRRRPCLCKYTEAFHLPVASMCPQITHSNMKWKTHTLIMTAGLLVCLEAGSAKASGYSSFCLQPCLK